jgi:hypothetical protein
MPAKLKEGGQEKGKEEKDMSGGRREGEQRRGKEGKRKGHSPGLGISCIVDQKSFCIALPQTGHDTGQFFEIVVFA